MPKFKITGYTKVQIVTEVEAETEEEARVEAQDRDVEICIHGSESCEGMISSTDWVLGDCSFDAGVEIDDVEELDPDEDENDEEEE